MASTLIVEVCRIKEIVEHENADSLEICMVKGWESIATIGKYKVGDLVVYIPVDSVLPTELGDRIGVRNYLGGKNKDRVRCAKLRGVVSYGLLIDNEEDWAEGTDVKDHYGITKYEPPLRAMSGDAAPEDPLFDKFTDIENIRNYPDIFKEGERVFVTEKLDGTNDRIGFSVHPGWNGAFETLEWKAGSHKVKRKLPPEDDMKDNIYWYPFTLEPVKNLLEYISKGDVKVATLYGEVYGRTRGGHKSMNYGKPNSLNYAAFSLKVNGKYLSWFSFSVLCKIYNVPMVPLIYDGPFNMDKIKELSQGKSILAAENGADHIREGVVVCADKERDEWSCGRSILKVINPDYLLMKNKREAKGEEVDFTDE